MLIKAKENLQLEMVVGMIDEDTADTETEVILKGETHEITLCDGRFPPDASEIQFGDGSVTFVTPEFWESVEIIPDIQITEEGKKVVKELCQKVIYGKAEK